MLLFFDFGGGEIFLIILVVLIFFGSKKMPGFARGLGKGIRQFKDAAQGVQDDIRDSVRDINTEVAKHKSEFDTMAKVDVDVEFPAQSNEPKSDLSEFTRDNIHRQKEKVSPQQDVEQSIPEIKSEPVIEPVDGAAMRKGAEQAPNTPEQ